ncbi:hypothetical protein NIES2119_10530 [[Phormidium ambiguum] IAM M-71]|uniref:Uncharacterized protein n=1 Tax=[Phormidium ambiguum] IAM M-71 TaxID=454136 RepID=A0A1U7IMP1_9CYAN|nr:hypothetical protein [Phormidium ambiguum]OKH38454.1 hypothetical protein NIES2119_10530 [Phormidium ambiguum IAM M-71]
MKRIDRIDGLSLGRMPLSPKERENLQQGKLQKQKEEGYQILAELCRLGEYNAARNLANKNLSWGYEIVDGEVMEKED